MNNEGYPEDNELDLIQNWDWKDTFSLIDFVENSWTYKDYLKKSWRKDNYGSYCLYLELHTGGWSGNESIINALHSNRMFVSVCYIKWETGGHHYYKINPKSYGFLLVSDFCKKHNLSRQAIYNNPKKYDWIKVSHGKQFVKLKQTNLN